MCQVLNMCGLLYVYTSMIIHTKRNIFFPPTTCSFPRYHHFSTWCHTAAQSRTHSLLLGSCPRLPLEPSFLLHGPSICFSQHLHGPQCLQQPAHLSPVSIVAAPPSLSWCVPSYMCTLRGQVLEGSKLSHSIGYLQHISGCLLSNLISAYNLASFLLTYPGSSRC